MPEVYKLIVAGGRDFTNGQGMFELMSQDGLAEEMGAKDKDVQLVCGMAHGADMTARGLFMMYGMTVHEFPADWNQFGKAAGHIRNKAMAEFADGCIAFWDGESRGTENMIKTMTDMGKPLKVFTYQRR